MKPKVSKKSRTRNPISKKGMAPGSHIYTGKNNVEKPTIEVIKFDVENVSTEKPELEELLSQEEEKQTKWININGISHEKYVRSICDKFKIHFLYQEDIMNVFQRPKMEEELDYIFLTFKSLDWNNTLNTIEEEQFSFILLENTILTFQEKPGDNMDLIRERLKAGNQVIMERSIDYLFYRLLDVTVDSYFEILEKMGDNLELLEDELLISPKTEDLIKIQNNKKDIMLLRKNVYPLRDLLNKLISSDHHLIHEKTKKYFKDVLDHVIQILETTETYRDINMSLKDVYLNTVSHEMNKVMKTLTIMSTLFIPLTFIVGVYGMNFKYMPELDWKHGYYIIWTLMIVIVLALSLWFNKRKWF